MNIGNEFTQYIKPSCVEFWLSKLGESILDSEGSETERIISLVKTFKSLIETYKESSNYNIVDLSYDEYSLLITKIGDFYNPITVIPRESQKKLSKEKMFYDNAEFYRTCLENWWFLEMNREKFDNIKSDKIDELKFLMDSFYMATVAFTKYGVAVMVLPTKSYMLMNKLCGGEKKTFSGQHVIISLI